MRTAANVSFPPIEYLGAVLGEWRLTGAWVKIANV